MEGIDYVTAAYGTTVVEDSAQIYPLKRASNGTTATNVSMKKWKYDHVRNHHTNNPSQFIPGTTTKWRNPSIYERRGQNVDTISTGKYFVGPINAYYFDNAPIDKTDLAGVVNSFSANPYFSGSATMALKTTNAELLNSRDLAVLKAYDDLASAKASMGENLATLNQTADLFATIVEGTLDVFRVYKALRSGRLPKISSLSVKSLRKLVHQRKVEKRLANYWLAYYYGFKPLASDASGLYELMLEQMKPALLVHGRGRSKLIHTNQFRTPNSGTLRPGYDVEDKSTVYHSCQLTGRINSDFLRTVNRTGLLNLPSIAWELVPFSFVVDWGIKVGSFLNSLTATVGLEFQGGHFSESWDRTILGKVSDQWSSGNEIYSVIRGNGVIRSTYSTWPKSHLATKPFYTGADRFATIAALLSNLTR